MHSVGHHTLYLCLKARDRIKYLILSLESPQHLYICLVDQLRNIWLITGPIPSKEESLSNIGVLHGLRSVSRNVLGRSSGLMNWNIVHLENMDILLRTRVFRPRSWCSRTLKHRTILGQQTVAGRETTTIYKGCRSAPMTLIFSLWLWLLTLCLWQGTGWDSNDVCFVPSSQLKQCRRIRNRTNSEFNS